MLAKPIKKTNYCQLPTDFVMRTYCSYVIQDINEAKLLRDWFIVLINANVKQHSDLKQLG